MNYSTTDSLTVVDVGTGKFTLQTLKEILPDIPTALFFASAYKLPYEKLGALLHQLFQSSVLEALQSVDHSIELQDYLIDTVPETIYAAAGFVDEPVKQGEILPHMWEEMRIEVAATIQEVAQTVATAVNRMPGKEGRMEFAQLARFNRTRRSLGTYSAVISHAREANNLVILDDSGSMTQDTVMNILDDVVALSWKANAHLVLVSNTARHWEPGTFNADTLRDHMEFRGTRYETLAELLDRDWGTVVTIADYDSSYETKQYIRDNSNGSIDTVLDVSLVNRPTFLAEVVGQRARVVRPLMIANSRRGFTGHY